MPRGIGRVKIKKVIDVLRKKNCTWTELKEKTNIPDKSLARILKDYLRFWGLIEKAKDETGREKWAWVENIKVYRTVREYDLDLQHSKKLLPAIDAILAEDAALCGTQLHVDTSAASHLEFRGELEFKAFLLQHLETGSPDIHKLVLRLRNILEKWYEYLKEIEPKYDGEIDRWVSEARSDRYKGASVEARKYWRSQWQEEFENAILFKVRPLIFEISIAGFARQEHPILKHFPDDVKKKATAILTERCQAFRDLSMELNQLRIKVNMGRPLNGHCNSCPKIRIRRAKSTHS